MPSRVALISCLFCAQLLGGCLASPVPQGLAAYFQSTADKSAAAPAQEKPQPSTASSTPATPPTHIEPDGTRVTVVSSAQEPKPASHPPAATKAAPDVVKAAPKAAGEVSDSETSLAKWFSSGNTAPTSAPTDAAAAATAPAPVLSATTQLNAGSCGDAPDGEIAEKSKGYIPSCPSGVQQLLDFGYDCEYDLSSLGFPSGTRVKNVCCASCTKLQKEKAGAIKYVKDMEERMKDESRNKFAALLKTAPKVPESATSTTSVRSYLASVTANLHSEELAGKPDLQRPAKALTADSNTDASLSPWFKDDDMSHMGKQENTMAMF